MVHNIIRGTLVLGLILAIGHWYYKHFIIDNPAPELLIAILILAIPTVLIFMSKTKITV
jgi:hypothetical protein